MNNMNKRKILNWRLKFIDPGLEEGFNDSKIPYQNSALKIVIFEGIIMILISWLLNPYNNPNYEGPVLYLAIGIIFLTLTSMLLARFRKKYVENIILVLISCYVIGLLESSKKNNMNWEGPTFFIAGAMIEIITATPIWAKVSWGKSTFLFALINFLCCTRYTDFATNQKTRFQPLIHFVGNTLVLMVSSFLNEKNDRARYYEMKTYERSLSSFKDLMKDVFPIPIIITKDEQILFQNSEASKEFLDEVNGPALDQLRKIMIDEVKIETTNKDKEKLNLPRNKEGAINSTLLEVLLIIDDRKKDLENYLSHYIGYYKKGDEEKTYDIIIKGILWEKKFAFMTILSENQTISNIKRLKEQSNYKDKLLATVSHDLRTPLNGVIGLIDLSMELTKDSEIQKILSVAKRSSNLLLYMINDILDYSQISNGRLRLNFECFSLWDLINDVADLIQYQVKQKHIELKLENKVEASASTYIGSDQNRLRQVILNLLGNALKFTERGSITVTLEENKEAEKWKRGKFDLNRVLTVKVTDTGMGIKKEDQPKLFKLFGKLEIGDKKNQPGVGLGLAISQNLVTIINKNIEGTEIKVISEFGKGSCFYFDIISFEDEENEGNVMPLKNEFVKGELADKICSYPTFSPMLSKSRLNDNFKPTLSNSMIKVLIVDDDQINIFVASQYLQNKEKYQFDVCSNGLEALNLIKQKARNKYFYDIILMDCNMPIMDGFQASLLINELILKKEISNLKIIACTANSTEADYEQCFESGMHDYLTKPFTRDMLLYKIDQNFAKFGR